MPDGELKRIIARRGRALVVVLAVGVAGVAWAGCGSDSSDRRKQLEASKRASTEGVEEAQERASNKGVEEAKKSLEGTQRRRPRSSSKKPKKKSKKGLEKGKKEVEKGIEGGKDEAQKGIEEAEKYAP